MANDLDEFIESAGAEYDEDGDEGFSASNYTARANAACASQMMEDAAEARKGHFIHKKWAEIEDGTYTSSTATVDALPPDIYSLTIVNDIVCWRRHMVSTDDIVQLPDTASERVVQSIEAFWAAKDRFASKGQLFKRGVLLYGPPGSGKTATINILMNKLVELGGIVLVVSIPSMATNALRAMRLVEPDRPVICVMEDLDEMIANYGESNLLSLLDGEAQIDNIVHLASTNYPERLDGRIINRPSRFDEVIKIGMPSPEARRVYLRSRLTEEEVTEDQMKKWVTDTSGLSIAHLRELVVSVFCLDRDYDDTIKRLSTMKHIPSSDDDAAAKKLGFGTAVPPRNHHPISKDGSVQSGGGFR